MRVLASAVAIVVVAGASAVPARDAVAQSASSGAQQSGNVLVIPAKPTMRARVSQWLSSWQANGGEVKGEAARAAGSDPQPKAKKPRRTAAKKPVKSARKAKQQQTASRPAKRSPDTPKPAAVAADSTPAEASPPAALPAVAAAPALALPGPPPEASVQVAPAYAAPPQVRRVPPSQTLHTPLADIPPVTLFVPPAVVGAAAAAPAPAAVAALPPPVAMPEPKPAVAEPPLPPATSRIHKQAEPTDEATWWRTEGEPAIVNFRDCIAAYAGREAPRRPQTSLGDLVIEAGAGDCRAPFEDMMTTLTVRYGRERLETAMGAILNETLLPAARAAADEASRSAGATDAAP
jgi:hypothetical protein